MNKIQVDIEVDANLEKAWKFWNEPELIKSWAFARDDWECPHAENNLVVGGKFMTRMSAKDKSFGFDFAGTYTDIKEYKKIKYVLSDDISDAAHWHIFPAVDDTLTVDGEGGEVLTLPSLHVNSITSVTERGRELEEWTEYEWSKTGDLKRLGGCWTTRWQGITVEMHHGYDLDGADFADLLKAIGTAVATAAANPLGIPEVMGPFQWQSSAGAWIGDAATTLGRYALPWSA
jgi:uncharacterized protein YndB with AHSA1/START domain